MKSLSPAAIAALAKGDLDNFMVAARPGGIEAQEAAGQQSFVASETLPVDMNHWNPKVPHPKEILEAAGVRFLGAVDGDPIFQRVVLPAGWKKVATDHSMWSNLLDEKGRKRAAIFYKAAFYDRSASLSMSIRYSVSSYDGPDDGMIRVTVKDGDQVIHALEPVKAGDKSYVQREELTKQAHSWLEERFPDYLNPAAYWD